MITLTTSIPVTNNVANINKWRVTGFDDNDNATPPFAFVTIECIGGGGKVYPPGVNFRCTVFDATPSVCLDVNPSPARMDDQINLVSKQLTNAYTAMSTAFYGKAKTPGRTALEAAAIACGLVPVGFAGT